MCYVIDLSTVESMKQSFQLISEEATDFDKKMAALKKDGFITREPVKFTLLKGDFYLLDELKNGLKKNVSRN